MDSLKKLNLQLLSKVESYTALLCFSMIHVMNSSNSIGTWLPPLKRANSPRFESWQHPNWRRWCHRSCRFWCVGDNEYLWWSVWRREKGHFRRNSLLDGAGSHGARKRLRHEGLNSWSVEGKYLIYRLIFGLLESLPSNLPLVMLRMPR